MRRSGMAALFVVVALVVAGWLVAAAAVQVGDRAPDFTLPATTQEKFTLGDILGKKNIVLFGFIGAFTPT